MSNALTPEQALGEIEELIRLFPSPIQHHGHEPSAMEWNGRALAVLQEAGEASAATKFELAANQMGVGDMDNFRGQRGALLQILQQVRYSLRMGSVGPIALAIGAGQVFDYFDALRQVIEGATGDLLFVDPYLNPDFVTRYLPHVKAGTKVRLLGQKGIPALMPSVDQFAAQSGLTVQIRGGQDLHDRWVLVDGAAAYHSGASFKDGGRSAPTTLIQAVDVFDAIKTQYEDRWSKAQQHR